MARSDELLDEANAAAHRVFEMYGGNVVSEDTMRLLRLAWFAGYGAGIDTASSFTDSAFEQLKAALA